MARFDQNGDGQLQVSELPPRARARLASADADGNGVITLEELAQHKAQRQAERFAKSDQDGDGKLTRSEVGERRWRRMSVADADGDGAVTAEELAQAHQQGKLGPRGFGQGRRGGQGHQGGPGRPGGRLFEHADENGDGKLTQSEVPEQIWSHISVADADGDGAVTQAEMQAARDNGTLKPPPRRGFGKGVRDGQGRPGGRLFERADKDGDGKLTQSEVPERIWSHISVADADGDGAVTQAEMQAARDNGTLKPLPRRGFGKGAHDGQGRPGGRGHRGPGPAQH